MGDLAGLDARLAHPQRVSSFGETGVRQPIAGDRLCEIGRFGQETRAGWYKYDENRNASPDPAVAVSFANTPRKQESLQRKIPTDEIVDRCLYALVNEGARILEEGFALRAVDIDIIFINGYGFPAHRGGPMWYADTVGLKKVYERVCEFHRQHGVLWEPAPLLKELAGQGRTFGDFIRERSIAPGA